MNRTAETMSSTVLLRPSGVALKAFSKDCGVCLPLISVTPGDVFRAEFAYLGTVTARFSGGGSLT